MARFDPCWGNGCVVNQCTVWMFSGLGVRFGCSQGWDNSKKYEGQGCFGFLSTTCAASSF